MSDSFYDLSCILDIPKWETLQDYLSLITKMGIITINYKGIPITKHSNCCAFCRSVRADPQLEKYCQLCDSRAGLEAVRSQKPYVYLCHFGIIDIAIPITINDKYIGAIMAGQVRLTDPREKIFEQILSTKSKRALQHVNAHQQEYDSISKIPFSELELYIQVLASLSNYIVETALYKNKIIYSYEQFHKGLETIFSEHTVFNLNPPQPNNLYVSPSIEISASNKYSILSPAFDYIDSHPYDTIPLPQMAALCHISPSYFSRLFSQKIGKPFSQYMTRIKIEKSKELLRTTDWSIAKISDELNFNSPGYYIKVFKKYEGLTPFMYKKHYCDE